VECCVVELGSKTSRGMNGEKPWHATWSRGEGKSSRSCGPVDRVSKGVEPAQEKKLTKGGNLHGKRRKTPEPPVKKKNDTCRRVAAFRMKKGFNSGGVKGARLLEVLREANKKRASRTELKSLARLESSSGLCKRRIGAGVHLVRR